MYKVSNHSHTQRFISTETVAFQSEGSMSLFQQIMNTMLSGLEYAMAYLDDILIKSENFKEHKSCPRSFLKN